MGNPFPKMHSLGLYPSARKEDEVTSQFQYRFEKIFSTLSNYKTNFKCSIHY